MPEETTPQETTQETSETPQAETTETPTQPSLDLDSTIKVDGQEISVRDLISTRDEAVKLREYNANAKKLISPSGVNEEGREQAVRFLMTQEGYSPSDIDEYVNWTKEATQEATNYEGVPQEQTASEIDPSNEKYYQEQAIMQEREQQRLTDIEQKQSRLGAEMMKKDLNNSMKKVFNDDPNIQKLLSLSEGENNNRQEILMKEVETIMMDNLKRRRASGENFNASWFDEEAGKATKNVYDKFRSVIGDPDKIQRSPETATDSDSLFNKPPVDPPKFEKGDDMGSINVKARDWTLDTLLRGAREDAAGGKSKA